MPTHYYFVLAGLPEQIFRKVLDKHTKKIVAEDSLIGAPMKEGLQEYTEGYVLALRRSLERSFDPRVDRPGIAVLWRRMAGEAVLNDLFGPTVLRGGFELDEALVYQKAAQAQRLKLLVYPYCTTHLCAPRHVLRDPFVGERWRVRCLRFAFQLQLYPHPRRIIRGRPVFERSLVQALEPSNEVFEDRAQRLDICSLARRVVIECGNGLIDPSPIVFGLLRENESFDDIWSELESTRLVHRDRTADDAGSHVLNDSAAQILVRCGAMSQRSAGEAFNELTSTSTPLRGVRLDLEGVAAKRQRRERHGLLSPPACVKVTGKNA